MIWSYFSYKEPLSDILRRLAKVGLISQDVFVISTSIQKNSSHVSCFFSLYFINLIFIFFFYPSFFLNITRHRFRGLTYLYKVVLILQSDKKKFYVIYLHFLRYYCIWYYCIVSFIFLVLFEKFRFVLLNTKCGYKMNMLNNYWLALYIFLTSKQNKILQ